MNAQRLGFAVLVGVAAVATAFTPSCGKSVAGYTAVVNYGGSGSVWTARIDPTTSTPSFTITRKATPTGSVNLTVEGTFERLASGILKLTVTSASGTDAPAAGALAYALDVPGFVFMLKPMGSSGGEIIPMVALSNCPSSDFQMAWVKMQVENSSTNLATADLAGSFNYTHSGASGAVSDRKKFDGSVHTSGSQTIGTLTCTSGIGTIDNAEMWFTTAGGAIVRTGSDGSKETIVGVPAASLTVSDFAGEYVGLVFDENDNANGNTAGRTQPVGATLAAAGTGTGAILTDVEAGTRSATETASLTLEQLSPAVSGLMKMSVGGDSYICAAAKDVAGGAQEVIFCATRDGTVNTKLQSYLLVKKP